MVHLFATEVSCKRSKHPSGLHQTFLLHGQNVSTKQTLQIPIKGDTECEYRAFTDL